MSDLISRKVLIEDLKECLDDCDIQKSLEYFGVYDIIKSQSTAYDVDKVVSELEKENERLKTLKNNCIALCDHEVIGIENKAYNYAIEIVKRGGKNE